MAKTISFVKEKGNINHNNRVFVTENIDSDRIKDNIIYVQQALASAYTKLFEEAINKYNEKQTRNDRKYGSVEEYMTKLKHSKNGEVYKIHTSLEDTKKDLNKITGKVEPLKEQSDYYEERLIGIEDIKYSMFSGKHAEKYNKALQYENKKFKNEKLHSKVNELQKAAEYWNLMYKGIKTFKDEKKKSLKEMVNNLIKRGKDPLQAAIDDKKELNNSYILPMIKNNNIKDKHYLEREER